MEEQKLIERLEGRTGIYNAFVSWPKAKLIVMCDILGLLPQEEIDVTEIIEAYRKVNE